MRRDEEGYLVFESKSEWREHTRYDTTRVSTAKSEQDIKAMLLAYYGADEVVISERQGGQVVIGFIWRGERYLIPVRRAKIDGETEQDIARLVRQAYRVLYHYLKGVLEMEFLVPMEETLMPFMMLEAGDRRIRVADAILGGLLRPALPPGEGEPIEGEFMERE